MEKGLKQDIEIVQSNLQGTIVFQLKSPKVVNKTIFEEIKKDISLPSKDSIVVYPEQRIIESNQLIVDSSNRIF